MVAGFPGSAFLHVYPYNKPPLVTRLYTCRMILGGMKRKRKTVGYIRVSTEEQLGGLSLETQRNAIRRTCEAKGWDLDDRWHPRGSMYKDEAEHSDDINRPKLLKMLDAIKKGKVERLVVAFDDRLLRGPKLMELLLKFFKAFEVEVYFGNLGLVDENIESILDFHGAQGKQFLKNLRMRTIEGMKTSKEKNHLTGRPPAGFTISDDKKEWVMTKSAVEIERLHARGDSPAKIRSVGLKYNTGKRRGKPVTLTHIISSLKNIKAYREERLEECIAEGREERERLRQKSLDARTQKEIDIIRALEDMIPLRMRRDRRSL